MKADMLKALIIKELKLVSRDLHGMALIILMPLVFFLVMSVALQKPFNAESNLESHIYIIDYDNTQTTKEVRDELMRSQRVIVSDVVSSDVKWLLVLPQGFSENLFSTEIDQKRQLMILPFSEKNIALIKQEAFSEFENEVKSADLINQYSVLESLILQALGKLLIKQVFADMSGDGDLLNNKIKRPKIEKPWRAKSSEYSLAAWMMFGLFFIAIPLSTAFIEERKNGSLLRLKLSGVTSRYIVAAKTFPFVAINVLQAAILMAAAHVVMPVMGMAEVNVLNNSGWLILSILSVSLTANAYALLVASMAKTSEQATVIGAAGIIILSAIGGVMVPDFVMPDTMQAIAQQTPLNWGLNNVLMCVSDRINTMQLIENNAKLVLCAIALNAIAIWRLGQTYQHMEA